MGASFDCQIVPRHPKGLRYDAHEYAGKILADLNNERISHIRTMREFNRIHRKCSLKVLNSMGFL